LLESESGFEIVMQLADIRNRPSSHLYAMESMGLIDPERGVFEEDVVSPE
jgi:hypothetical protein